MLYNFVHSYGESNIGEFKIVTVEGTSVSDAIVKYVLNDNVEDTFVLFIVSNCESMARTMIQAIDVAARIEKSLGDLGQISVDTVSNEEYRQVIVDNLTKIVELIYQIADGTTFFAIQTVRDVVTGPQLKSVLKN